MVLKLKFLFSLTCTSGASRISVGQCCVGQGKHPIFPEEVGIPCGFGLGAPLPWIISGRLWFFWPVCSWYCLPIARSCQQSHSVGVDPAASTKLCDGRWGKGGLEGRVHVSRVGFSPVA